MLPLVFFFFLLSPFNVVGAAEDGGRNLVAGKSPLTVKASVIRHWKKEISNDLPKPPLFLLNKASPLTAVQVARFSKLADQNALSTHLPEFCSKANLLCSPDISDPNGNGDGAYSIIPKRRNFPNFNKPAVKPAVKAVDGGESFNTYGSYAPGTVGEFKQYNPGDEFTTYSTESPGRVQRFSTYTDSGDESFSTYAENADGAVTEFKVYGENSNAKGSHFDSYAENGNGAVTEFKAYSANSNAKGSHFVNYADNANGDVTEFKAYAKGSLFDNYAETGNGDINAFSSYRNTPKSNFRNYGTGAISTFKDYRRRGNGVMVEPGVFFREDNLRTGTMMPMPDIEDKMPKRSFLPRVIVSKLPFSVSKIPELHQIFNVKENSTMAKTIKHTLTECERAPSKGEIKRCVASVEDMVNFATSVLGRNSMVRTTENTAGSKGDILIGSVKGINGGNVTKSVSCHQSLFPYLVYYCHAVPNVHVYEADILDPKTKNTINHGVAICHLDTSAWSPTHKAFLALRSEPGKIEVCHWIFENDMTWAVADRVHSSY